MISFRRKRRAHLALGRKGEKLAASQLCREGYTILARNWRTKAGELDIVACKEEELLFAEVKTIHRKKGFSPYGNLSLRQRRRNMAAGKVYLSRTDFAGVTAKFDLFSIEYDEKGRLLSFFRTTDYMPPISSPPRERESFREKDEETLSLPWWKRLWLWIDFFPCPVCGRGKGGGRGDLCPECRSRLDTFSPLLRSCPGCGGELDGVLALCSRCLASGNFPLWQGILSLFPYRGLGRRIILDFKYGGRSEYCRFLGEMGAEAVRNAGFAPDIVTFIPMHWTRKFLRRYNQAELFAARTAAGLGVPCTALLCRSRRTSRQATLARAGRLKNQKGAFRLLKPENAAGKTILLADDVFTTGATVTAAVKVLMKAHPRAVYVLTAARTIRRFPGEDRKRRG